MWYYASGEERRGPIGEAALLELLHLGAVGPETLVWTAGMERWAPLAGTALFYLLGQVGLMMALRRTEPSRVSPLLGFKIVILAVMSVSLPASAGGTGMLSPLQWAGVALCVVAAVSLNYSGARLSASAAWAVVFACVAYSLSDWHIKILVDVVTAETHSSRPLAATLATCLCYIVCGGLSLAFLPFAGPRSGRDWRGAIPFALSWFVAMLFLFASFGFLNVVFGNILQSTRGLMSVAISSLLVRWGMLHLEPAAGRGVFVKRLASAAVMIAAVALYMLGLPPKGTMKAESNPPPGTTPATR